MRPFRLRRKRVAVPDVTAATLRATYFPRGRLDPHLFVLPEERVVYVKNPKAGSSTIVAWLSRVYHHDAERSITNAHLHHEIPPQSKLGWAVVGPLIGGEAYRFSFVRDPYRRFESAYYDKVVGARRDRWRAPICAKLGLPAETVPTFEQFVTAVELQDPVREMDEHWQPQHVLLMHPMVEYDRIGHLERFDADFALVREEAGLPDLPVEVRNVNGRRKRPRPDAYKGRPDLRSRVHALYAEDFELYDYEA